MDDIVLNSKLKIQLEHLATNPPHAMLLVGPKGAGKKTILGWFINLITEKFSDTKVFKVEILNDKKSIGIDQVKQLKNIIKTKDESFRIIYISQSDKLTKEAQNSLLKILEEPPKGVIFVLAANNEAELLQTIRSRVVKILYKSPSIKQQKEYIDNHGLSDHSDKLLKISSGNMGLLSALCGIGEESEILHSIDIAKDILSESIDDRLLRIESLIKDSEKLYMIIDALMLTCNVTLNHIAKKGDNYIKWLDRLENVLVAKQQLHNNVLPKLVLTRLFLVI
jgi:DNA polymerase-3 subunit delta'